MLLSDYEQLKRFFYIFVLREPGAEQVVARDHLSFLRKLWRDWSPGFQPGEHLAGVRQSLREPANLAAAIGYYGPPGSWASAGELPVLRPGTRPRNRPSADSLRSPPFICTGPTTAASRRI